MTTRGFKMRVLLLCTIMLTLSGCSVFGKSGVEQAPYTVLEKENDFELRHYDRLVLVTTAMPNGMDSQNSPFYKLFNYISGKNDGTKEIPMTAPVFMEQANQATESMSFVLPKNFTIETAPTPQDPDVKLEELTDYTVATITFTGLLRQENIEKHKTMLEEWITNKELKKIGAVKAAGYNPPFTIPAMRRNEILIQVQKP
jgi:hypothetical protein